jgi:hypothetical protein
MGSYSPNADWAAHHPEVPALSLIVAVDTVDEGTRRSVDDMLEVIGESSCEVIVASREIWPDARPEVTVVACTSDSPGVRFDRAASRAHGRILAFLDDHVRLPDGWPQRVIEFFDDPAVAMAGGPVLPRTWSRAERVSALILNGHLGTTPSRSVSPSDRPRFVAELTEPNLLIRNDVFRGVGGFRTPRAGGETMWLCYRVRSLLGCKIHYQPDLAVVATARRFPGPFLADTAANGRARGDMARGFVVARARRFAGTRLLAHAVTSGGARGNTAGRLGEEVAPPFFPYALPALVTLVVILELGLLIPFPHHPFKAAVIGGLLLFVLYLMQAGRVAFARGPARFADRALAALGVPLVSVTYGFAFVRGFFDTRWRL